LIIDRIDNAYQEERTCIFETLGSSLEIRSRKMSRVDEEF